MKGQKPPDMNEKSGEDRRNLSHFSKTDVRHWNQSIFRKGYTADGQRRYTQDWYARVQHGGRRDFFALQTPNKAAAAARARDIYLYLVAHGWEPTLAKYKPKVAAPETTMDEDQPVTVGRFLEELMRETTHRRTVEAYAKAFRQIVSDLFGFSDSPEKYDHRGGGWAKWLAKVHAIKLAEVTPARVQEWKRAFLAQAESDTLARRKARISVNSTMRQARSLFSPKMLRHVRLPLPEPLPFAGVEFEPRQSMKYRSGIDLAGLIEAAGHEFRDAHPEAYKVFLLGVAVGLRRKEIDLLEWSSFLWDQNVIRIQPTRFFHPKSEDSLGDLPVDPKVMALFHEYQKGSKGPFVIQSSRPPLPVKPRQYYRCEPVFSVLVEWLRAQGVTGNKPLHTLRKEYGSLLTQSHGIHAASRALRHADLRTTSEHYSDSAARVTPGIDRFLPP